jgi:hypothetical protein
VFGVPKKIGYGIAEEALEKKSANISGNYAQGALVLFDEPIEPNNSGSCCRSAVRYRARRVSTAEEICSIAPIHFCIPIANEFLYKTCTPAAQRFSAGFARGWTRRPEPSGSVAEVK